MPVLKNDVVKPFPGLPERHQATLDKLHVLLDQSEQVNLDFQDGTTKDLKTTGTMFVFDFRAILAPHHKIY